MRHRRRRGKLGRRADHRQAVLRNLARALILHGEIETTEGKGKEVNRFVQKLVTLAKGGASYATIRRVNALLADREAGIKLFELAPRFKDRNGGYTQLFKTGFRRGDAASTVLLRFIPEEGPAPSTPEKKAAAGKERKPAKGEAKAGSKKAPEAEKKPAAAEAAAG